MPIHGKLLHTGVQLKVKNDLSGVWNKNIAIKNTKNILFRVYWPLSDAMLPSKVANQEEDKIRFFFFIAIN